MIGHTGIDGKSEPQMTQTVLRQSASRRRVDTDKSAMHSAAEFSVDATGYSDRNVIGI